MALYSDGNITSLSDLRDQETGVLDAAHAEGVDLTTKLRLAQQEIGVELTVFLLDHGRGVCGETAIRDLRIVVVTPALKQWHTFQTLALTYRDLYYNQYNDRYSEKWQEYSRQARNSAELLFDSGVGVVTSPLERAAAPTLSTIPGGQAGGTFFAQIAWVHGSGAEGAPSEMAALVTDNSTQLVVTPPAMAANAVGWNVYVGTSEDGVTRQNDAALGPGEYWVAPNSGLQTGALPGNGQSPDSYVTRSRTFRRG